MYLGAPLVFLAFQMWPIVLRRGMAIGLPIVVLAVFLSSSATQLWQLVLTQGVLYAIGGNLVYYPIFVFIDEWFVRRKGIAYGVMWAGSGCGGLVGPLVLHWGLTKYGVKTFLRGWSVALVSIELHNVNSTANRGNITAITDRSIPLLRQITSTAREGSPHASSSNRGRVRLREDQAVLGHRDVQHRSRTWVFHSAALSSQYISQPMWQTQTDR